MIVGEHRLRVEVYGIGHRHPVTVPVSVCLAAQLAEAGAPVTVRVEDSARRWGAVVVTCAAASESLGPARQLTGWRARRWPHRSRAFTHRGLPVRSRCQSRGSWTQADVQTLITQSILTWGGRSQPARQHLGERKNRTEPISEVRLTPEQE